MKKCVVLIAMLFTGVIFAQDAKPVLEPFGKKIKATYFYDNGQVQQEGYFVNGKLDGIWVMYNEGGDKIASGEYDAGVKVGKWFFWSQNNDKNSLCEVDFSQNKIDKVKNWRQDAFATSN
ncbi:toxin-antitoxin system YwqK family antitoxin [Flavobacterium adhaerens]|uniref:toxin-antitoxin system YwqK family antitoxin n=1 Tax=Flavobacterium adhaerens TaxID=3149043 RepID=UPI0032B332B4